MCNACLRQPANRPTPAVFRARLCGAPWLSPPIECSQIDRPPAWTSATSTWTRTSARPDLFPLAVGMRRLAHELVEDTAEVGRVLKANATGDSGDALARTGQELFGGMNAQPAEVLPRRESELAMKDPAEVVFAYTDGQGDVVASQRLPGIMRVEVRQSLLDQCARWLWQ